MSLRLRKRHRLRKKEIYVLSAGLEAIFLKSCFSNVDTIDKADAGEFHVILVNGDILGLVYGDVPFLTVKGLLKYQPDNRYVTVDMGAVKYIYNGADVMAPGIVNADCDITKGDLIWVRDEKNLQPLAVGRALMSGKEMVLLSEGKAVRSIHHVGDEIWNYSSER
jgi:PUA domain protein